MNYTQSRKTTASTVKGCDNYRYTPREGYAWAEIERAQGFNVKPEWGNWPYVIVSNGARYGRLFIKEYAEHEVKTWAYADDEEGREEYTHHMAQLDEYYKV